ncbi:MAG TPA: ATP-binding protein [Thermoanaerobaculia bacterium]|nr:ATP-binding protein [Thermoanaerobaculia bacterium]
MLKTLYARLALVLFALFLLMAGVYLSLTLLTTRLYSEEVTQRLNRTLAADLAREKPVMKNGRIDAAMLRTVFDALMTVNPNIEIYLLDDRGTILSYSAPPGKVKRTRVALDPVHHFLAGGRLPIRGDDPRHAGAEKVFSAASLPGGGYLYVILGGEDYDSVVQQLRGSYILQLSAAIGFGGLLFGLVAALLLFAAMTRRLRALAEAMSAFRRSDFSKRVVIRTSDRGDEVDRLASTFREMADRMILQIDRLKEADLLRRELVANVSHDLRTPLASLQGYLETLLLKEGALTPDEQRRFLEIAGRQSERLGRLVAELFELAKLDSQQTPIRVEPFSMAELVQDVVVQFRLRAEQAGVALSADIRPDLPLVRGDIALLERVLVNLIDNAIRHTPAGGSVVVSLVPDGGKLSVRVTDTGSGIAEEALPFIFDRFYKAEAPEGRGGGAGLGLAIAKRILELHGTMLYADSRVRVGTTFAFQPPVIGGRPG